MTKHKEKCTKKNTISYNLYTSSYNTVNETLGKRKHAQVSGSHNPSKLFIVMLHLKGKGPACETKGIFFLQCILYKAYTLT